MKAIGIIGAMEIEIALLKERMDVISVKQVLGVDFYVGNMAGKNVIAARSRVGKVNAAICAQALIDLFGVDYVINTGVAGALSEELNIGDVVISSELAHHDFDMTALGDALGVNSSIAESFFKADEELIRLAKDACGEVLSPERTFVGRIASGDVFIAEAEAKNRIKRAFNAMCVDMEGAAVAQTCFLNQLPFVVIRSISDKADGGANESFEKFVKEAANSSCSVTERVMENMA
ncbi:MAG: 5'-methylthioadenosine/adenosylhomocysteine nucleosidase [Clostridiales bacterium]|jgi:adenosylhomocysteine nucleosidase|nr:5'-methylthioadenosine/adenosylhomocysteine nucleosidase [Clostridiales bacterium]